MPGSEEKQGVVSNVERIERVRQAVIRRGGSVTVGDIVAETGFPPDEAEKTLRDLITTHEGTMKVSENGEIVYAFTSDCIERDYRSWWQRSKAAIYKGFKAFCKVLIMLVLVVYFIIYLIILIALLSQSKGNNRSSGNAFNGMIYIFWGRGSGSYDSYGRQVKKEPLYNRIYKFIFGPEEEKTDPMQLQKDFAQLVRSKKGVVTAEDWMIVSGKSMAQSESDMARYTAIYDGDAQICEDGTLVYVFPEMMKSTRENENVQAPAYAWDRLEHRRPLTGNESNVAVILLNLFNLVMAFICMAALTPNPDIYAQTYEQVAMASQTAPYLFWLGTFPLIFSILVFAGPLIRLPFNIKENRRRRRDNIRKVVLENVENARTGAIVNGSAALKAANHGLHVNELSEASVEDVNGVLDELATEMNAEPDGNGYRFNELVQHTRVAEDIRNNKRLDKQKLGRVIYSTDSKDDEEVERNAHAVELEDFDRAMSHQEPNMSMGHDYRAGRASSMSSSSMTSSSHYNRAD